MKIAFVFNRKTDDSIEQAEFGFGPQSGPYLTESVAARQGALYKDAADFEPQHAINIQEAALRCIDYSL